MCRERTSLYSSSTFLGVLLEVELLTDVFAEKVADLLVVDLKI